MSATQLLAQLQEQTACFADVLSYIETHYIYTPTAFQNGELTNTSEQNQGSAKVFAFAKLLNLSESQTLQLFAEHYQNVLDTPENTNHQNIRQFMQTGWNGISFTGSVLQPK